MLRFFKYFIFIIAALVILFFAIGMLKPTVQYGHEIEMNKPVTEAWAVTQDEQKYAEWLDGFKSIELISGEKGEVGSKYKVVVNPGEGQPDFEMTQTIVSIEEADHVTLHFDSEMMEFDQTMTFEGADGKSTIRTDSKVHGKGLMMRSTFALMEMLAGSFTAQETKNMEALKDVIEQNEENYDSTPVEAKQPMDSISTLN